MNTRLVLGCVVMTIPAGLVYLMMSPIIWDMRAAGCPIEKITFWKRCRRLVTLAVYIFCVSLLFAGPVKASTVDISHDNNKGGSSLATLVVVGSPIPEVNSLVIVDTTGYYDLYPIGTTTKVGDVSVSGYAGIEGMKGVSAKPRGMVIASYASGDFCVTTVIEFAGNTGNFNKQTLCYKAGSAIYSLVRHSVAGNGVRVDLKTQGFTPYVQILARRVTVGVVKSF
jgi:hypothetical protein